MVDNRQSYKGPPLLSVKFSNDAILHNEEFRSVPRTTRIGALYTL